MNEQNSLAREESPKYQRFADDHIEEYDEVDVAKHGPFDHPGPEDMGNKATTPSTPGCSPCHAGIYNDVLRWNFLFSYLSMGHFPHQRGKMGQHGDLFRLAYSTSWYVFTIPRRLDCQKNIGVVEELYRSANTPCKKLLTTLLSLSLRGILVGVCEPRHFLGPRP